MPSYISGVLYTVRMGGLTCLNGEGAEHEAVALVQDSGGIAIVNTPYWEKENV